MDTASAIEGCNPVPLRYSETIFSPAPLLVAGGDGEVAPNTPPRNK